MPERQAARKGAAPDDACHPPRAESIGPHLLHFARSPGWPLVALGLAPRCTTSFPDSTLDPMTWPFTITERIRWEDVDAVGIMRYSAVTRLMDVAEAEMLRDAGASQMRIMEQLGAWLPRRVLHIEFHAPAKLDALVALRARVARIGTTSLTVEVEVADAESGVVHALGRVVIVCVGSTDFRPRPVPDELRARLAPYTVPDQSSASATVPSPASGAHIP